MNRIITRGMGTSRGKAGVAGMVTQGYGGFFRMAVEFAKKAFKAGQSGAKRAIRELEEVIISARLIRVNDEKPKQLVQGSVTVKLDATRKIAVVAEGLTKRVRAAWEDIKITVKRIR